MIIGVRVSVDLLHVDASLSPYLDIPVELALPYRCDRFLEEAEHMPELEEYLLTHRMKVNSVHATQGRLAAENFWQWAFPAVQLAQAVNACRRVSPGECP